MNQSFHRMNLLALFWEAIMYSMLVANDVRNDLGSLLLELLSPRIKLKLVASDVCINLLPDSDVSTGIFEKKSKFQQTSW